MCVQDTPGSTRTLEPGLYNGDVCFDDMDRNNRSTGRHHGHRRHKPETSERSFNLFPGIPVYKIIYISTVTYIYIYIYVIPV